ncbi:T9SS type A sorting domain-containing protein, partial [Thiomicrospira sp.]|uniref:T9SS type A sorting domain-containing protein n=1 Tax=Thiomicrospira sp. TaxID=935 RepID=UPI002F934508
MKKALLFVFALAFGYASVAQVSQLKPQAKFNTTVMKTQQPVLDQEPFFQYNDPIVANERAQDIVVGETWYDLQSNSTMAQRMYAYPDGSIGATWTRGMTPTAYSDRGSGYNYYDGSAWGPYPTERVEDVRTGWPSYAPYGANGEIICSHTGGAAGLQFSWRENKGTGDWNYFQLAGPAEQPDLLWPRMITSGENNEVIHVIAAAGNAATYEGLTMALLYSRSSDGGLTWDPQNVILEGTGSDVCNGWGGDDYAWANPVGNTIAFVAFGGIADGIIMKSTDGGDNWERITFYESPDPFFDGNGGNLPQCGGGDGYNALVLDDEGMAHVAFGRQIHLDDTPDDAAWSYYPYSDGLVYWNETMPVLDTAKIGATILPVDWTTTYLYQNGMLAAWTQDNGDDTIVGVAPYYASLTSMPQMVLHNGILQFFYGGLAVGYDNTVNNYRHIWGRFTELDGNWSEFTDYTGDVFHLFSECVFPSVAPYAYGETYHILYQSDNQPGNSLQPTDAPTHDPILNNMVYLPVSIAVGVEDNLAANFEVSQNMPNPAVDQTTIVVNLQEQGSIRLTVSNILGQTVYETMRETTSLGANAFKVDVSEFKTGMYVYTVEVG